jgi:hypothetical protein
MRLGERLADLKRRRATSGRSIGFWAAQPPVLPAAQAPVRSQLGSPAGRPQDELDLQLLVRTVGTSLDWSYCESLAREPGDAIEQDLVGRVSALRESLKCEV